jgi:hypothetical protein
MELGLAAIRVRSPLSLLRGWMAERVPRWRRATLRDRSGPARAIGKRSTAAAAQGVAVDPIVLRQWLYGPGCVIPGDADYLKDLVKPFGLCPEMTLLDLHAGMGGAGVAIAQACNTYVESFEPKVDLVRAGAGFLKTQKSGRRVHLGAYDPANFALRPGFYDCVLAREATVALADKNAFLAAVTEGLKPFGQIAITEFVRGPAPPDATFNGWAAMQDAKPDLWAGEQYVAALERLGFNVLMANDATAGYRGLILRSWQQFLDRPELKQLKGRRALPLVEEAEHCIRTLAALDSGALRYFYICAQSRHSGAIR